MKYLLDTQLLLWASGQPSRLSRAARKMLSDDSNQLMFSACSIWEITIKNGLGRKDFRVDPRLLRSGLLGNEYVELAVSSEHALTVGALPAFHTDPFDRLLVAQAIVEDITLLTSDDALLEYPAAIRKV